MQFMDIAGRHDFQTGEHAKLAFRQPGAMERQEIPRLVRAGSAAMEDADPRRGHDNISGAQGAVVQQLSEPRHPGRFGFARAKRRFDGPASRRRRSTGCFFPTIEAVSDVSDLRSPRPLAMVVGNMRGTRSCPEPYCARWALMAVTIIMVRATGDWLIEAKQFIEEIGLARG